MNISFTGHREFDRVRHGVALRECVEGFVARSCETTIFWSGMAVGFDLAAAEVVLELRGAGCDVRLCCVVPYIGQDQFFSAEDRERYEAVLGSADRVVTLAEGYSREVFYRRNDYLVEQADSIIAYFDGVKSGGTAYTVRRARRAGVAVENIYPCRQLSLF